MSSCAAIERGGEAISVWELRSRFFTLGEEYCVFYCPYCGIRLKSRNLYKDEFKITPHFAEIKESHLYYCNGEGVEIVKPEKKPIKAHHKPRSMHYPEILKPRPISRILRTTTQTDDFSSFSKEEYKKRRKDSLGKFLRQHASLKRMF